MKNFLRNSLMVMLSILILLAPSAEIFAKEEVTEDVVGSKSNISSIYDERLEDLITPGCSLSKKYIDLLVICYVQITQIYLDDEISEDWYFLQTKPILNRIESYPSSTDEEILEEYKWLLSYQFDDLSQEEAEGFDIDQVLFDFIISEVEYYGVAL